MCDDYWHQLSQEVVAEDPQVGWCEIKLVVSPSTPSKPSPRRTPEVEHTLERGDGPPEIPHHEEAGRQPVGDDEDVLHLLQSKGGLLCQCKR